MKKIALPIYSKNRRILKRKPSMIDFAAIDFETANRESTSICSVGIVIVRKGVIVEKIYRLIQPEPNYYEYWNTRVHGLTCHDTDSAPLFSQVWREIAPQIEGLTLVAHNSAFDRRCLESALRCYRMDHLCYSFRCTVQASRKAFPDLPNHQLPTVAAHIQFPINDHHNALCDAEACARIALEVFR